MKNFCSQLLLLLLLLFVPISVSAAELKIGTAKGDITPQKVVPLWGQFHLRLSKGVETPLTVNVTAIEAVENGTTVDSVIFASADLLQIPDEVLELVRQKTAAKEKTIDTRKIVLNGTHTHTAPGFGGKYSAELPNRPEIMKYDEIREFVSEGISQAIVAAWRNRQPGKMSYGLEFEAISYCRRYVRKDGAAVKSRPANDPQFDHFEAFVDQDIGVLFFWDKDDSLVSVIVNVNCPSQQVEGRYYINADFWHCVRNRLYKRFGNGITVLGWCGAAGDLSGYPFFQKEAAERMLAKRGLESMEEIARKLDRAVESVYSAVKDEKIADVRLVHQVKTLDLPMRKVTEAEYEEAKKEVDLIKEKIRANPDKSVAEIAFMAWGWHGNVVRRFEAQKTNPNPVWPSPVHVVRLGDVAICTNAFELFNDYGTEMKVKSPARQTFIIQLVGSGSYLPTERAARGGSYSAVVQSTPVGPAGGRMLVDETVQTLKELWR